MNVLEHKNLVKRINECRRAYLLCIFKNVSTKLFFTNYSGHSFRGIIGFGKLIDLNSTYYVADYYDTRVIMFDENWNYLAYKSFSNPCYIITVNCTLYITGDNNVFKTDKDLNILKQFNASGSPLYRGIEFNQSNKVIFVASCTYPRIDIFDLNLTLSDNINTSPYRPYALHINENLLYAGDSVNGYVLLIWNKAIINVFRGCSSAYVTGILIDIYGFIATSCFNFAKLNLTQLNGTSTGLSINTPSSPFTINFDSKGLLIQISLSQISIFI